MIPSYYNNYPITSSSSNIYNQRIDITVTVKYTGLVETQYFSELLEDSIDLLLRNLQTLKIPLPPRNTIKLVSHGMVEFGWPGATRDSPLLKVLYQKIEPPDLLSNAILEKSLQSLSIAHITIRRRSSPTYENHPYYSPSTATTYSPRDTIPNLTVQPKPAEQHHSVVNPPQPSILNSTVQSKPAEKYHPVVNPPQATIINSIGRPKPADQHNAIVSNGSPRPESPSEKTDKPISSSPRLRSASISSTDSIASSVPSIKAQQSEIDPEQIIPENMTQQPINSLTRPSNNADALSRIKTELLELRKYIAEEAQREDAIISELMRLGSTFKPEPTQISRVEALARLEKVERDLEEERKKRLQTEEVINDIRKECRAPFIVPALLDAFITVSKLTTQLTSADKP